MPRSFSETRVDSRRCYSIWQEICNMTHDQVSSLAKLFGNPIDPPPLSPLLHPEIIWLSQHCHLVSKLSGHHHLFESVLFQLIRIINNLILLKGIQKEWGGGAHWVQPGEDQSWAGDSKSLPSASFPQSDLADIAHCKIPKHITHVETHSKTWIIC